ncbi:MAG: hypothetical protein HRU03_01925 [Nanoarchaeales archaeon]|nr:hypothetical protein [Nanoarchaeales archaeon]
MKFVETIGFMNLFINIKKIINKKFLFIYFIYFITFFLSVDFSNALSLSVNVPDKYSEVTAGEKFFFELVIKYPENLGRVDLRFEYKIFNPDNELIAQSKVLKAIETQASFIDSISIPSSAKNGLYSIEVKILDYAELDQLISTSFHVVSLENDKLQLYFIILIIVGIFIAGFVLYDLKVNHDFRESFRKNK